MSGFVNFKFPVGARFRFGSFECRANANGDLEQIPVRVVEEPRREVEAAIRFGLPADWQIRREKQQAARKKGDRPFSGGRFVGMAGRGRAQSFPTIGASEFTGAESSSGAHQRRRIPMAPNNLGAQFESARLGAVLESLRRLVPQGDAAFCLLYTSPSPRD